MATAKAVITALSEASNDAADLIAQSEPYSVVVGIEGACPVLFHRWSCESVESKAKAAKNSRQKKTDDVESYIWRNEENHICLPGEYLKQAIVHAAKFRPDPRSPRKSAMDLFKAGVVAVDDLCPINGGVEVWDYLDQRRVTVQRAGITRVRPAFLRGWRVECQLMVLLPEYIEPSMLNEVTQAAGRLIGVADHRPSYGRFNVTKFETAG